MRPILAFSVLSICTLPVGCGFRGLTDKDVAGTYEASTDWGRSTLVLNPDHSFDQKVVRNDHTQAGTKGTWKLSFIPGRGTSSGIIALKPFLDVEHDHKGDLAGGAVPSINRGFLWGITISADPDYGISFDKK